MAQMGSYTSLLPICPVEIVWSFSVCDLSKKLPFNPSSPSYKYLYFPEPYLRFFTYKKENAIVGLTFIH